MSDEQNIHRALKMLGREMTRKRAYKPRAYRSLAAPPGSAWVSVKDKLPDWEKDRDHDGDTVSRYMVVFHLGQPSETGNPPRMFLADTAKFHFPTGEWCWRDSKWEVTHWIQMPNK